MNVPVQELQICAAYLHFLLWQAYAIGRDVPHP